MKPSSRPPASSRAPTSLVTPSQRIRARQRLRRIRIKRTWRVFASLSILLGPFLVVLLFVMFTDSGRELARRALVEAANREIAGTLRVERVARLDPGGVVLYGVELSDPEGNDVARLGRLEVDPEILELLLPRVHLRDVMLRDLWVDARPGRTETTGLTAAIRVTQPSEEDTGAGMPVHIDRISVVRSTLQARLPRIDRDVDAVITDVELDASVEYHPGEAATEVHVTGLDARVDVDGTTLARFDDCALGIRSHGQPSDVDIHGQVGGAPISLRAVGVLPGQADWQHAPLHLNLDVEQAGPALLRAAGAGDVADDLGEPLQLEVRATGTPMSLDADWSLSTPGGEVGGTVHVSDLHTATLDVKASYLRLSRLWRTAPDEVLSAHLAGEAAWGTPRGTEISAYFSDARLGDVPLPSVDVSGRLLGGDVHDVHLHATGYGGELRAEGNVSADGVTTGKLDVKLPSTTELRRHLELPPLAERMDGAITVHATGKLTPTDVSVEGRVDVAQLRLPDVSCAKLSADWGVVGKRSAPSVGVKMRAKDVAVARRWVTPPGVAVAPGNVRIVSAGASVEGGPQHYELGLDATFPASELHLTGTLARGHDEVSLDAQGNGHLDKLPWTMKTRGLKVSGGTVQLTELDLQAAGQSFHLSGTLSRNRPILLVVEGKDLDLEKLTGVVELPRAARGRLSFKATAEGHADRPHIGLTGGASGLALRGTPGHHLLFSGALDARQGTLAARLHATSGSELELDAETNATFETDGPWVEALAGATHELRVDLKRLHTSYVQRWLPLTTIPADGHVSARVALQGPLQAPIVEVHTDADVEPHGAASRLRLAGATRYDAGFLQTSWTVRDERGEWLAVEASLDKPSEDVAAFSRDAALLLHDARWEVSGDVARRRLGQLPYAAMIPEKARPIDAKATFSVLHGPREEPTGNLGLELGVPYDEKHEHCLAGKRVVRARGELAKGKLRVRGTAGTAKHPVASFEGSAAMPLAPALEGERPPEVSQVGYSLELEKVDLREVPVLCTEAYGKISAGSVGSDLLGDEPLLDASVDLHEVGSRRLGGLSGRVRVEVDARQATLRGRLTHERNASLLSATLPVRFGGGKLEVVDSDGFRAEAKLRRLPARALIPRDGPVSRVTGFVDGDVKAHGRLSRPRVHGTIVLDDIGLTATALAQPLRRISGTVEFNNDVVHVRGLTAKDKDGTLRLDGDVDIHDLEHLAVRLDVEADEFPVRQEGRVVAQVDLAAHVKGTRHEEHTEVEVALKDVDVWLQNTETRQGISLEPHPDVVDPRTQTKLPAPDAVHGKHAQRELRARIHAKDSFWVKRDDFAVKLGTDLDVLVQGDTVQVQGPIRIDRGYLELLGETFDIKRGGSLTFVGTHPPDPVLALRAKAKNTRSSSSIEVAIGGRASAPIVTFFIDGAEVTAGDAALAIFGSDDTEEAQGVEQQAQSFATGVVASVMAVAARRELGAAAPIIMIDPGDELGDGQVRAGFELDSLIPDFVEPFIRGVYVEGIVANESGEAESSGVDAGVLLELYFPHSFVGSGSYGPGQTWSLDVAWEP